MCIRAQWFRLCRLMELSLSTHLRCFGRVGASSMIAELPVFACAPMHPAFLFKLSASRNIIHESCPIATYNACSYMFRRCRTQKQRSPRRAKVHSSLHTAMSYVQVQIPKPKSPKNAQSFQPRFPQLNFAIPPAWNNNKRITRLTSEVPFIDPTLTMMM